MEYLMFSQLSTKSWDEVIYHSDDGWSFSFASWLDMVASVWNMENHSFAIKENGEIAAVMPLHWSPGSRRLASGGWGPGGPVVVSHISQANRERLQRACWNKVDNLAEELGAAIATASIIPLCQSSLNNRWGVNPLVFAGFSDLSTHTRIVDLVQSENDLWYNLAKDARQKIKQARSSGYSVRRCSWKTMLDKYYQIHVETYERTGVEPHPKAYFEGIAEQASDYHVLWAGFDPNDIPVAFHNDARFKNTSWYHTGCSQTAHLKSGINYLLFWEAIAGARADGCLWYETGETFPQAKYGKEKGLTDFKSKFGGELHRVFRGEKIYEQPRSAISSTEISSPEVDDTPKKIVFRLPGFFKKIKQRFVGMRRKRKTEEILARTRSLYSQDGIYNIDTVDHLPPEISISYSDELLKIRLELVRKFASNAVLLDVCCATGHHLNSFSKIMNFGIGVDFSFRYIERANFNRESCGAKNVSFVCNDASKLPLHDHQFDVAYSFSALYQIPNVDQVIREMARVLKPNGKCILDMGNVYSLNTFVNDAYPELPDRNYISVSAMKNYIRQAGLVIADHRAFQILPMWSDRPKWLKPLLWPGWVHLLQKKIGSKMLDEWISNLPGLKLLAFRHIFVCEKR